MPLLNAAPYQRSAMRESVADAIRRTLLEGGFRPGEVISEVPLAAEFRISRGPVREALLTLAKEGLLVHSPNRGFRVLEFSAGDLEQIEAVRGALEPLALAAGRNYLTAEDARRLTSLKEELVQAFSAGRHDRCVAAEVQFHGLVWQLSNNPWLVASLERVMIPGFTYGAAFRMTKPDLSAGSMDRLHQMYIEYLKGADEFSAEECVRLHLNPPAKGL